MHRIPLIAALVLALSAIFWTQNAQAGVLDPDAVKVMLHTATPQEGDFIERVCAMVDKGTLPVDMVQSTLIWARKKPSKKFYYFRQALILRAADLKITIKP
jgi:hypothetical protein